MRLNASWACGMFFFFFFILFTTNHFFGATTVFFITRRSITTTAFDSRLPFTPTATSTLRSTYRLQKRPTRRFSISQGLKTRLNASWACGTFFSFIFFTTNHFFVATDSFLYYETKYHPHHLWRTPSLYPHGYSTPRTTYRLQKPAKRARTTV